MTMDERDLARIDALEHRRQGYLSAAEEALTEIRRIKDRMRKRGYEEKQS